MLPGQGLASPGAPGAGTAEGAARQDREPSPEMYLGAVHVEGFRGVAKPVASRCALALALP